MARRPKEPPDGVYIIRVDENGRAFLKDILEPLGVQPGGYIAFYKDEKTGRLCIAKAGPVDK